MDAPALALEAQLRQLTAVLDRLVAARRDLVPAPATFWWGPAREAYDTALLATDAELGSCLEALRFARENTLLALTEELRA